MVRPMGGIARHTRNSTVMTAEKVVDQGANCFLVALGSP
jgi:hypothetical protein